MSKLILKAQKKPPNAMLARLKKIMALSNELFLKKLQENIQKLQFLTQSAKNVHLMRIFYTECERGKSQAEVFIPWWLCVDCLPVCRVQSPQDVGSADRK